MIRSRANSDDSSVGWDRMEWNAIESSLIDDHRWSAQQYQMIFDEVEEVEDVGRG